jgi:transcriptional regulator with XRE-family HTH domain
MERTALTANFGRVVRRLRSEKGFSQEAFADECGLHRTYMGAIERGEKSVTIETAGKVARALSLPLWKLMKQVEEE